MSFLRCPSCVLVWRRAFSSSVPAARVQRKRVPFVKKDSRPWQPQYPLAWKQRSSDAVDPAVSHKPPTHWEPVRISESMFYKATRSHLNNWSDSHVAVARLAQMGISASDAKFLLVEFHKWASAQLASPSARVFETWYSDEFAWRMNSMGDFPAMLDLMIMRRFLAWVAELHTSMSSHKPGQPPGHILPAVQKIASLYEAADMRYPAELFPEPRRIRRKIIMHVGPTNSGKTYNALRALAAAKRGVYAGPLRLLAHEVYTRLNKGAILPAGIERNPLDPEKLYPRACNMITGEEKRIVAEDAPLTSCTVEMLQWITHYDVAVVDEIQMIGDEQRGGAWTSAVLGLMADELHLCGEESAVPVIEALAKETGDELIINHYERLSPLRAASSSLEGDLSKLREGDCVVAFSRRLIFQLKTKIEQATQFRCAVAYGMLPPELRAEQAALFNDPNNEYGIMVASDAIGMGLNLKIKRIIFFTTEKYDGQHMVPLSLSTVKQIAGRAGRFSLGAQQTSAGIATSLEPEDLPVIQLALRIPTRPLKRAVIAPTPDQVQAILQLLPPGTPPSAVFEVLPWMARVPKMFTLVNVDGAVQHAKLLETLGGGTMSISEYWVLLHTPAPLKEEVVTEAISKLVPAYKNRQSTSLIQILEGIGLMRILDQASKLRNLYEAEGSTAYEEHGNPPVNVPVLAQLERMHRVLIMYLWLSYRLPVAFSEQQRAFEIKEELERCIAFFLREMKPGPYLPTLSQHFNRLVKGLPDPPAQSAGVEDAFDDDDDVSAEPEWMQEVNTA